LVERVEEKDDVAMYEKLNSLLTMIIEKQRNATLLFLKLKINYF